MGTLWPPSHAGCEALQLAGSSFFFSLLFFHAKEQAVSPSALKGKLSCWVCVAQSYGVYLEKEEKTKEEVLPAQREPGFTLCKQILSCLLQSVLLEALHTISSQDKSSISIVLLDIMPLHCMHCSHHCSHPACMRNDSVPIMQEILASRCLFCTASAMRFPFDGDFQHFYCFNKYKSNFPWTTISHLGCNEHLLWQRLRWCHVSRVYLSIYLSTGPACGSCSAPHVPDQSYPTHEVLEQWKLYSPILWLQDPDLTGRDPAHHLDATKCLLPHVEQQSRPHLLSSGPPLRVSSAPQPTPWWSAEICFTSWGHGWWKTHCWAASGGGMEAAAGMRGWGGDVQDLCGEVLCWGDGTQSRHRGTEWLLGWAITFQYCSEILACSGKHRVNTMCLCFWLHLHWGCLKLSNYWQDGGFFMCWKMRRLL